MIGSCFFDNVWEESEVLICAGEYFGTYFANF